MINKHVARLNKARKLAARLARCGIAGIEVNYAAYELIITLRAGNDGTNLMHDILAKVPGEGVCWGNRIRLNF
jgi:hypothetical protein